MNYRFISYIVGWILNFQGIFLIIPSFVALYYGEDSGFAYVVTSIICLAIGIALTLKKPSNKAFMPKMVLLALLLVGLYLV